MEPLSKHRLQIRYYRVALRPCFKVYKKKYLNLSGLYVPSSNFEFACYVFNNTKTFIPFMFEREATFWFWRGAGWNFRETDHEKCIEQIKYGSYHRPGKGPGENLKKKRQKAREKKTTYVNSSVKGQRN